MQTLLLAADAGANPVNVEWLTLVTTIVIFYYLFTITIVYTYFSISHTRFICIKIYLCITV